MQMENPLDAILDGQLYLGNWDAASNLNMLKQLQITHVLTALVGCHPPFPEHFEYLVLELYDIEKESVLDVLPQALAYISNAIQKGGRVFVHCQLGQSRSATIVAFYLMQRDRIGVEQVLGRLRAIRATVAPNPGFVRELHLFERMGFSMEGNSQAHAEYHLLAVSRANKKGHAKIFYPICGQGKVYRCKGCGTVLFSNLQVSHGSTTNSNTTKNNSSIGTKNKKKSQKPTAAAAAISSSSCTSCFIEPVEWLRDLVDNGETEGKIDCPSKTCNQKLGRWCWQGSNCSCGSFISPAFQITMSKID